MTISITRQDASHQQEIRRLRDRVDALQACIEAMEEALLAEVENVWRPCGLSRTEGLILGFLLRRKQATIPQIHQFLYASDPAGGAHPEIIRVHIYKIRKKLPGIEIRTLPFGSHGYELPPASIAALKGESPL